MHLVMQIDLSEDIQILCIARDNIEKIVFAQVCLHRLNRSCHDCVRDRVFVVRCCCACPHLRARVCRRFDITGVLGGCEQAHRLSAKIATMDEVVLDSGADAAKQV